MTGVTCAWPNCHNCQIIRFREAVNATRVEINQNVVMASYYYTELTLTVVTDVR